ncbi:aldehyde dehydrogenase family protein [Arthrobacter sp. AL08]|uniref:aldehyde dehydrogenase family protein n=1 Tax=unclassified Arthrobacter TaxID=235627 RepID=UPI00249C48F7|nr:MULTISPECIES: aldehyde dehydrogenase family protein [unclassified Arthrobacter]MDI3242349.1 aldehyde dehydrogenase family protein [Arthrobacter sp. AL05]MDI3278359.1 aldehyde dehydrogenase family protein [Arthrobacter sp. AL08]
MQPAAAAVARAREIFDSGATRPLAWRLERLAGLRRMLADHSDDFAEALGSDLGKHATESLLAEVGFVTAEAAHLEKNLKGWLRPRAVAVPLAVRPAKAWTELTPLGVVLVIGPWNYPLQLLLAPLAGALAAGNTAVLKPSEHAPATSAALARWIPEYLAGAVQVVEGGIPETTALLAAEVDHIFFTGGETAAKVVLRAAAENLTPVTLELGGKSPAYVDASTDLAGAAKRIAWGKFINAGQTCVAPDYVLATKDVLVPLERELVKAIGELFGPDASRSDSYGRIVNDQHFARLAALADGSTVVHGGQRNAATRYFAPTLLRPAPGDALMGEEIFGPLLPLVPVAGREEAIRRINDGAKPLALYVFSGDEGTRRAFADQTSSGALCFDVPAAHLMVPGLPFGGVGASEMGAYHGEYSLRTFSHERATLAKPLRPDTLELIYPPYNKTKRWVVSTLVAPVGKRFRKN